MGLFGRKKYDEDGYDKDGYDKDGFKKDGEMDSVDDLSKYRKYENGYDVLGFDNEGSHKITRTKFDEDGYDRDGWNISGIDKNGMDRSHYEKKRLDVKEKEEEKRRKAELWETKAKEFAHYQEEEKWEDAIKCANILLEQTPDREDIMGQKAWCYYNLGLHEEALKIYEKCKTDETALNAKSILLEEMGRTEELDDRNYADRKEFNE